MFVTVWLSRKLLARFHFLGGCLQVSNFFTVVLKESGLSPFYNLHDIS